MLAQLRRFEHLEGESDGDQVTGEHIEIVGAHRQHRVLAVGFERSDRRRDSRRDLVDRRRQSHPRLDAVGRDGDRLADEGGRVVRQVGQIGELEAVPRVRQRLDAVDAQRAPLTPVEVVSEEIPASSRRHQAEGLDPAVAALTRRSR